MEISEIIGLVLGSTVISNLVSQLIEALKNKKGRLGRIEKKLDEHIANDDMRNAVSCRCRILRFGDEMREGRIHSEEHFEQIMEDIRVYDAYCKAHPEFPNDKTVTTSEMIRNQYKECMYRNDFGHRGKERTDEQTTGAG